MLKQRPNNKRQWTQIKHSFIEWTLHIMEPVIQTFCAASHSFHDIFAMQHNQSSLRSLAHRTQSIKACVHWRFHTHKDNKKHSNRCDSITGLYSTTSLPTSDPQWPLTDPNSTSVNRVAWFVSEAKLLVMVALCNRADHYIFALWFLSSIYLLFFLA